MTIISISGWEAKGLAATGGVVSPSLRKKKLLNTLIVLSFGFVAISLGKLIIFNNKIK